MDDLGKLLFGQILGADAWINVCVGEDLSRIDRPDAIDVTKRNVYALVRRNFHTNDTCHTFESFSG